VLRASSSLPDPQNKKLELHLRTCRECRDYLVACKRTIEIGKTVLGPRFETVPEDEPENLIRAVLNFREG